MIDRLASREVTAAGMVTVADGAFTADEYSSLPKPTGEQYDLMIEKSMECYLGYSTRHPDEVWDAPDLPAPVHERRWTIYRDRVQKQLRRFVRRQGWDDALVNGLLFRAQQDAASLRPRANALILSALVGQKELTEEEVRSFEALNVTIFSLPSGIVLGPVLWHPPLKSLFRIMSPTLLERFLCRAALTRSASPSAWKHETDRAVVAYLELYKQFVAERRTKDLGEKGTRGSPVRVQVDDDPEDKLERSAWDADDLDGVRIGIGARMLFGEYAVRASEADAVRSGIEEFNGSTTEWARVREEFDEDGGAEEEQLATARGRLMTQAQNAVRVSGLLPSEHVEALELLASEGAPAWDRFVDLLIEFLLDASPGAREMMYEFTRRGTLGAAADAKHCSTENVRRQLDRAIKRLMDRTDDIPVVFGILEIRVGELKLAERWDRLRVRRRRSDSARSRLV